MIPPLVGTHTAFASWAFFPMHLLEAAIFPPFNGIYPRDALRFWSEHTFHRPRRRYPMHMVQCWHFWFIHQILPIQSNSARKYGVTQVQLSITHVGTMPRAREMHLTIIKFVHFVHLTFCFPGPITMKTCAEFHFFLDRYVWMDRSELILKIVNWEKIHQYFFFQWLVLIFL